MKTSNKVHRKYFVFKENQIKFKESDISLWVMYPFHSVSTVKMSATGEQQ